LQSERGIDADMPAIDYDWTESGAPWPLPFFGKSIAAWIEPPEVFRPGPRLYAVIQ